MRLLNHATPRSGRLTTRALMALVLVLALAGVAAIAGVAAVPGGDDTPSARTAATATQPAISYRLLKQLGVSASGATLSGRLVRVKLRNTRRVEIRLAVIRGRQRNLKAWNAVRLRPGSRTLLRRLNRTPRGTRFNLRVTARIGNVRARRIIPLRVVVPPRVVAPPPVVVPPPVVRPPVVVPPPLVPVNAPPTAIALSSATVAESEPAATTVGELSATDANSADTLSFALADGAGSDDNAAFTIVGNALRTATAFDFESKASYAIRVRVSDGRGGTFERALTIAVTDVNDAPSALALSNAAVAENRPAGTTVGSLSATDQDAGDSFAFALVSGAGSADNASFAIAGAQLQTGAAFDVETKSSYAIRVRVTDSAGATFEREITVAVTNANEAPTDLALSAASVAENQPSGTTVGTLSAVDPDAGDSASFALVAGTGDADNASFAISAGALRTTEAFDFETRQRFTIRVRATDAGGLTSEQQVTISVTNVAEAPTDVGLSNAGVAENQPAGTAVGTLSAVDPDAGETYAFSLVAGTGDSDNASFQVVGDALQTAAVFDLETKSSYSIRVQVTDGNGGSFERQLTVTVTDANDVPTDIALSNATVAENQPAGALVGLLSGTDADPLDPLSFALVAGAGDAGNAAFSVDGTMLRTSAAFDLESQSSLSVRVRVSDGNGGSYEEPFTVTVTNVNEAPTGMALSAASVVENQPAGTAVGALSAVDPDAGDSAAFVLVTGLGDDDNAAFQIVGGTLQTNAAFDFETKSTLSIRVRASDAAGLTFDKQLTIAVTDAAEPPTDITLANANVVENQPAGTAVGALTAVDPDAGETYTFTFAAGAGDTDNAAFQLAGGMLQTGAAFDFEAKASYAVRLGVSDGHGGTVEQAFTIAVTNANDAPTDVALSNATVAENGPSGTLVGLLSGSDEDALDALAFSLVAGAGDADNASFQVSGTMLQTAATLNFETRSSYSVRLRASDGNGGSIEEQFTITLTNANDAPSDIALAPSSVDEGQPAGTTVGSLSAADADQPGDTLAFSLVAGAGSTDNAQFQLDGSTLQTAAVLDVNAGATRSIRISVSDGAGGTFEQPLTVTVGDINLAPTDIGLTPAAVGENEPSNTTVGTLAATDPDAGDTFTFSLVSGAGDTDNGSFNVAGSTLRTSASLNFEAQPSYTVRVAVSDGHGGSFEQALTVSATNTNDAPTDAALSNATVVENSPIGALVGLLSGSDEDPLDALTFSLVAGAGDANNASFQVSGTMLQTAVALDFETKSSYSVRVRVSDGNGVTFEKPFTITVTDANDTPTNIALSPSSLDEGEPAGTTVGSLSATDADRPGDTFTFSLVPGDGSTDNAAFQVSASALQTAAVLDFEAKPVYAIRVAVADGHGGTFEQALTVTIDNVNEAPATVALSPSTVAENQPVDTVVGTLTATDPDAADTHTFSLVSGAGDTDNASFNVAGDSLRASAAFDFEAKSGYAIRVRGTDSAGLTFDRELTVTVTNANDAPTDIALSSATVRENQASGAAVGALSSSDQDAGATHAYTLVSGTGDTDNAKFQIVAGALQAAAGLNFETTPTASIRVRTTDNGGLTYEESFEITIVDINDAPVADDESFSGAQRAIANTSYVGDDPTDGAPDPAGPQKTITGDILAGDADEDVNGSLAVVAGTFATADGGSVDVQSDGDFTFSPKADTSCSDHSDSFDYTITDQNTTKAPGTPATDTGTVTIEIQDCVWYVDSSLGTTGNGTSSTPYNALAPLNVSATDVDAAADRIFLYDGTYAGGLTLESQQPLSGQRHGLTVPDGAAGNVTLEPPGGGNSQINGGLVLATDNTVQGIHLGPAAGFALSGMSVGSATMNTLTSGAINNDVSGGGVSINGGTLNMEFTATGGVTSGGGANGIALTNTSGTFTAPSGTLSNASGADVSLSGGTTSFTYGGAISDDVGQLVAISGQTAGTKDFNGAITDLNNGSGNGISLSNNTGATIRFDGGLALSTGGNAAFSATGGGTLAVTDPAAVNNTITTTTGTALNVANTTIHDEDLTFERISSNGAQNGIGLNTTANANGRLVVAGNAGVCTSAASCSGGAIQASTGAGIALTNVPGGATLTRVAITGGSDDGIRATTVNDVDLADSVVLNNGNYHAAGDTGERGLEYLNVTGTPQILRTTVSGSDDSNAHIQNTVTGSTTLNVDASTFSGSKFNAGLRLRGEGPSVMNATVVNSFFPLNADPGFSMSTDSANTAQQTLLFNNNEVSGGSPTNPVSARPQISINADSASTVKATVTNNKIKSAAGSEVILNTLANHTTAGRFDVKFNNNAIGDSQPGTLDALADGGSAIHGWAHGDGITRMEIRNNTVQNWGGRALELSHNDGTGDADYTVTGNVFSNPDVTSNTFEGMYIMSGGATGDASDVCVDMENNDMDGIGRQSVSDIALDRFNGNLLRFADFNDTSVANLVTNLRGKNTLSPALTVETYSFGPTATADAACDLTVGTP